MKLSTDALQDLQNLHNIDIQSMLFDYAIGEVIKKFKNQFNSCGN
jgi:hypothetical protein